MHAMLLPRLEIVLQISPAIYQAAWSSSKYGIGQGYLWGGLPTGPSTLAAHRTSLRDVAADQNEVSQWLQFSALLAVSECTLAADPGEVGRAKRLESLCSRCLYLLRMAWEEFQTLPKAFDILNRAVSTD